MWPMFDLKTTWGIYLKNVSKVDDVNTEGGGGGLFITVYDANLPSIHCEGDAL